MKKRFIAAASVVMMTFGAAPAYGLSVDAGNSTALAGAEAVSDEEIADQLCSSVGTDGIKEEIEKRKEGFQVDGSDVDVTIPLDGTDGIMLESGEEAIGVTLPDIVGTETGEIAGDGTIVYNPPSEDAAIGVQVLSEGTGTEQSEAVRIMVEINNYQAGGEYSFKYDLPDGYSLMKAETWYDRYAKNTAEKKEPPGKFFASGEVYVTGPGGEVIDTVEPAFAADAKGNPVPSHYEIKGDELVQIVALGRKTAMPVVTASTTHPNKTKIYYLTKKQTKKVRDRYTGSTASIVSAGVVALATGKHPAIGAGWGVICIMNGVYTNKKFKTWDKIYCKFPKKKKYVRISAVWKWHSGHKTYYPTGRMKAKYVKSK